MAADNKKPTIVIKKIIVQGGGGHGGSWKVALADFMTALMAFFLVMWIVGQSDQTKKAVSDYFSTPSVIEYNYQNFGAEITLEKLFLDLMNEPLKAVQSFMQPMHQAPNLLEMGSSKVVAAYIADQLRDVAKNVEVNSEGFDFDIPDYVLFEKGTSQPNANYVDIMTKMRVFLKGMKDAEIKITSGLFVQSVPDAMVSTANRVASLRYEMVRKSIIAALNSDTVTVGGGINVKEKVGEVDPKKLIGFIRIKINQKPITSDGRKPRKLENLFGEAKVDMSVYDNFVQQMSNRRKTEEKTKKPLKQQIDQELRDEAKGPSSLTD